MSWLSLKLEFWALQCRAQSQKYKTDSPDKVVVDIGTGYYMEKSSKNADRKVKFVTENIMILTNINII